ncbi:hypothetical protein R1flu_005798 [Riccia fluitans]|uniref:Uncharacterized protein n=1 Tax=Riccia fluitans TaxID=41844 RepID=A0ABD1YV39_9MARC
MAQPEDQTAIAIEVDGSTSSLVAKDHLIRLQNLLVELQLERERLEIEVIWPLKDRVQELPMQLEYVQKELEYARASSGVTDLLFEYEQTVHSLTDAQTLIQQLQAENLTITEELRKKKIQEYRQQFILANASFGSVPSQ